MIDAKSWRILITASLLALLVGCKGTETSPGWHEVAHSSNGAPTSMVCPDEARTAGLDKVYPMLGHMDLTDEHSLDSGEKSIACLRPWAHSLTDACQRDGILSWCDHFEGKIREARVKLAAGVAETDMEKYHREQREKEGRVRAWVEKHPFPALPQCRDTSR